MSYDFPFLMEASNFLKGNFVVKSLISSTSKELQTIQRHLAHNARVFSEDVETVLDEQEEKVSFKEI